MPKLSRKEFEEELNKIGEKSPKEEIDEEIWKQNHGYYDELQVIGMVFKPGKLTDWEDDDGQEHRTAFHKYQIGVLDTKNNQKYLLHLETKLLGNYIKGSFEIEKMEDDVEYTHYPIKTTMIRGLSIDPDTLSYKQIPYFASIDADNAGREDCIHRIYDDYYSIFRNNIFEMHNNVFDCELYEEDGYVYVHKDIFEPCPQKERDKQKKAKILSRKNTFLKNRRKGIHQKIQGRKNNSR